MSLYPPLEPCPFCGHVAGGVELNRDINKFGVWCLDDLCKCEMLGYPDMDTAINAWNNRSNRGIAIKLTRRSDVGIIKYALEQIQRKAFQLPPPNPHTPEIVGFVIAAEQALQNIVKNGLPGDPELWRDM